MASFTHFDSNGNAQMVDISRKSATVRQASAQGFIRMTPACLALISSGEIKKGDVLAVARIAAIQAAKKTSELIPLCHQIALSKVSIEFELQPEQQQIKCLAMVKTTAATGVEMEALTAVQIALLTIYDMAKAVDKGMLMHGIQLLQKSGGKSGDYQAII